MMNSAIKNKNLALSQNENPTCAKSEAETGGVKKAKRKYVKSAKKNSKVENFHNNKLSVLRRLSSNCLDLSNTNYVIKTDAIVINNDDNGVTVEAKEEDRAKKGTMLIMDNYACKIFDILALDELDLPEYNPDEPIDCCSEEYSKCNHAFRFISQQTRSADEMNTIIKICDKCNAVFHND